MKTNTKNHSTTNQLTKFEQKKKINLTWNSTLSFQVGLIISVLLVGLIVESIWMEGPKYKPIVLSDSTGEEFTMGAFIVEQDIARLETEPVKPKPKQRFTNVLKCLFSL